MSGVSFPFRDCNKVQEKRGAVYEQVTTINQEIQKIKSSIQQLKDAAKREKLKSQVRAPKRGVHGFNT